MHFHNYKLQGPQQYQKREGISLEFLLWSISLFFVCLFFNDSAIL